MKWSRSSCQCRTVDLHVRHISEAEYYRVPERSIYKSYPVYAPGREPEGYQEWLKTREAEIAFDSTKLHSREEWIGAGEVVFNWPLSLSPMFFSAQDLRDPEFLRSTGMPVAKDGTIPFTRWWFGGKARWNWGR